MALPVQVQRQVDEAERIQKEVEKQASERKEETPAPTPEKTESQEAPAPETSQQIREESSWEHKYNVLEGKYRAEVPQLHSRIRQLENILASMETVQKKASEAPPAETSELNSDELPPEVKAFSEEYPDVYKAMTILLRRELKQNITSATRPIEQSIQKVSEKVAADSEAMFYSRLAAAVPDWEGINKDPEFIAWLYQPDRYTGATKYDILMDKFNRKDVNAVALFFKDFKEIKDKKPQAAGRQPAPYVAPPSSSTGAGAPKEGDGGKRMIPQSEVLKFYQQLSLKRTGMTPEEQKAKEAEYELAGLEGRIVPD